ncbi:MAG: phosphate ABC transporter substrate-binding protein [Candidatus Omnitrophota bacterium]
MKNTYVGVLTGLIVMACAIPCWADKIVISGSTTVLPIAQKAAEVYMDRNPSADISVRGGGSGVGISSIIQGTCNIGDASRPIKESELQTAAASGKDIKAHVVAMDGIAVVVNPGNSVNALTKQQLKDIFTGKISDWSAAGGSSGKIVVISRDSSSGTFEAFGELALNKEKVRPDALMQASNQGVASTISRTPNAIGYVGLGFMNEGVKPLELNGVMPSKESVLSGKYPLGRPLFMYTNGVPQGLTKEFLDFIKSIEGQQLVEGEGFVGLK